MRQNLPLEGGIPAYQSLGGSAPEDLCLGWDWNHGWDVEADQDARVFRLTAETGVSG